MKRTLRPPLPPRLEDGDSGPQLDDLRRGALVSDARVKGADLANSDAPELALRRVELGDLRIDGCELRGCAVGEPIRHVGDEAVEAAADRAPGAGAWSAFGAGLSCGVGAASIV